MKDVQLKKLSVLEQAGLPAEALKTDKYELSLLRSVALLRLHSLQALTELNGSLRESNIQLPAEVNRASGQDPSALCLAPSDWLLFSEYLHADLLSKQVKAGLDTGRTSLLDVSAAYGVLRLSGPVAPWLLGKICGLDFHQGITAGQHCTRTALDHAPVILHYHQPGSGSYPYVFDIICERSLSAYLWTLLQENLPHACELEHQYGRNS